MSTEVAFVPQSFCACIIRYGSFVLPIIITHSARRFVVFVDAVMGWVGGISSSQRAARGHIGGNDEKINERTRSANYSPPRASNAPLEFVIAPGLHAYCIHPHDDVQQKFRLLVIIICQVDLLSCLMYVVLASRWLL